MGVMEARRRIIHNSPHLTTLSDAGVLNFNTDMKSRVKECKVYFSPVQSGSGDPAPDNVRPITGWTGVDVGHAGSNEYNSSDDTANKYIDQSGAEITNTSWDLTDYFDVSQCRTVYYKGLANTGNAPYSAWYNSQKQLVSTFKQQTGVNVVNVPSGAVYVRFSIYHYQTTDDRVTFEFYTGTTYPVTFPAVGKNLFDKDHANVINGYINGSLKTIDSSAASKCVYIPVRPNTKYYITKTASQRFVMAQCKGVPTVGTSVSNIVTDHTATQNTITIGQNSDGLVIWLYASNVDTLSFNDIISTLQVETGGYTAYEPYTNTVYGGYVDLVSGELTATHGIMHLKNTTFRQYIQTSDGYAYAGEPSDLSLLPNSFSENKYLCSAYKKVNPNGISASSVAGRIGIYVSGNNRFVLITSTETTADGFNAELQTNDAVIVYQLATPITYQLTPQQLSVLRGENNFWSNANGNTDLSFWTHGSLKGLPAEYKRVEYLESTGTQYFWTDINIQDGLTVDSVQMRTNNHDSYLFGGIIDSGTENNRSCFNGCYYSSLQGSYPSTYYLIQNVFTIDELHHFVTTHKNGRRTIYADGNLIKNDTVGTAIIDSNAKCACFGARKADGSIFELYRGRVYSLKVSKDGTLLANYIPCIRKLDSKPGMYDTVSKTFYTNAGTGEFTVPTN